jgi:hypothetical protein
LAEPAGEVVCLQEGKDRRLGVRHRGLGRAGLSRREALVCQLPSVLAEPAGVRRIYQRAGFTLVREQPEHSYGHDLIAEDWARSLSG